MSGIVSEPYRSDEQKLATSRDGDTEYRGERHYRIQNTSAEHKPVTMDESNEPDMEDVVTDISAVQKMLSAVSGSLLTSLLVTPLDVVRVRLQSQPQPQPTNPQPPSSFANLPKNIGVTACCREVFWVNNTSPFCIAANPSSSATVATLNPAIASDCAVDETRKKTFTSTFDGLRKIARNEGPTSLWRGLSPTLVMAVPANVIYFTGYDTLRTSPHSPINKLIPDAYAPLLAGSIARIAAASVISPIEMFRTRMQAATSGGTGVFTETLTGLQKMVHSQGYTSLWRGLTLTMWRDVPFSGIYWWGYETIRNRLTTIHSPTSSSSPTKHPQLQNENHTSTFLISFTAGALSGAIASIITTPFDVGKTRRQVLHDEPQPQNASSSSSSAPKEASFLRPEERSMPRFLWHIWQEEGAAGLFRGWVPRMLKVAPACAIMISSYEVGKKMARRMNERKRREV